MESAFGVNHGGISKAMTPNKMRGLKRIIANPDLKTTRGVAEYSYAGDKLTAVSRGKSARTAPKPANPGGWMSANNKLAHQGREASQRAKTFEASRSGRRWLRKELP